MVHETLQASILEWIAIPFSRGSSQPRDQTHVSCIAADSLPAEPPGKPKHAAKHTEVPGTVLRKKNYPLIIMLIALRAVYSCLVPK